MKLSLFFELLALVVTAGMSLSRADGGGLYGAICWSIVFAVFATILYKLLDYFWGEHDER